MNRFLCYTAKSPAHDLALEEAIHSAVEDGSSPNSWRVWQAASPAVILGTGQESAKEVDLECAKSEQIAVLRRHSGGGTVVIGPGAINYSATFRIEDLPGSETIQGAMSAALKPVIGLLCKWGLNVQAAGLSDLSLKGTDGLLRKLAGNSQARKKLSVVVHGTLLADPDWERLERLLRFPSRVPDYRAGRQHRDFLTSLKENEAPFDLAAFGSGLLSVLSYGINSEDRPSQNELALTEKLFGDKYARSEWNLRR